MKIGACYIRVSTDDQMEYSPDSQLKELQKYAKANDIIMSNDFIFIEDEGRSGRSAKKRPEFQRMIHTAKQKPKPFDIILLWKFSRFARNREDAVVYKSMLRKQCGIDVISISENVGDDKMSMLIEAIIEAMDEWYSVNLAEEVRRGMTERFSRGEAVSIAPFGYMMQDKKLIPHPQQAPMVQFMFESYINGVGLKPLATSLNSMGQKTNRGNLFENRVVRYILTNPIYVGKVRWTSSGRYNYRSGTGENTEIVDGVHEGIVSQELFDQVQDRITQTASRYRRYAREESHHMLQGLMRCSNCGATLVASGVGLQCHEYAKGRCDKSHYIQREKAEALVIEYLLSVPNQSRFVVVQSQPEPVTTVNTPALISREKQKLTRIQAAYEDGIDTLEEYKEKKAKILQRIDELGLKVVETPRTITAKQLLKMHAEDILKLQDPQVTEAEKNVILRSFVEKIVFNRGSGTIQMFLHFDGISF